MKIEKILVYPKEGLIKEFLQQGCFPFTSENLEHISQDAVYGTRHIMEENRNFKQCIPYTAFVHDKKVFVYKRGSAGGEGKLHAKYSIGVGGHVDLEHDETKNAYDVILDAASREIEEEIDVTVPSESLDLFYAINDDSNDVGKVHFGLCFVVNKHFDLEQGEMEHLEERVFMNKKEMADIYDSLETWSQLFYDAVIKDLID